MKLIDNIKNKTMDNKNLIIAFLALSMLINPAMKMFEMNKYEEILKDINNKENQKTIEQIEDELEFMKSDIKELENILEMNKEEVIKKIEVLEKKGKEIEKITEYLIAIDMMPIAEDMDTKDINILNRMKGTDEYNDVIFKYATEHNIDPLLVKIILYMETAGNGKIINLNLEEDGKVDSADFGFFQHNFKLKTHVMGENFDKKHYMTYEFEKMYYTNPDGEKERIDMERLRVDFEYSLDVSLFMLEHKEEIAMDVWESDSKWHLCRAYNGGKAYANEVERIYSEFFHQDFETSIRMPFYEDELKIEMDKQLEIRERNAEMNLD